MHVQKINASPYDSNIYLINKKFLIDTGMESAALVKELENHIDLNTLDTIILTHCHFDHSGAASKVAEKSGAKIAIHEDDVECLQDNSASAADLFGYKAPGIEPDIIYKDGDKVQIADDEYLQIIHTPGHTKGCICLYELQSKSLFSGDTVFPSGSVGRTDLDGGSADKLEQSIEKLTEFDVKILYPGHGNVSVDNVNEQIKQSHQASKQLKYLQL